MKRIMILILVFFIISGEVRAQDTLAASSPVFQQLAALNLNSFVGQPLDSLYAHLPSGVTGMKIGASMVRKRASYLIVQYAPKTSICMVVQNFTVMNPSFASPPSDYNANWSISQMLQETLSFAIIFNGNTCINGCSRQLSLN